MGESGTLTNYEAHAFGGRLDALIIALRHVRDSVPLRLLTDVRDIEDRVSMLRRRYCGTEGEAW